MTLSVQLFAFDQDMEKETVIWEHIFSLFFFPSEEQQVVQIYPAVVLLCGGSAAQLDQQENKEL